MKQGDALSLPKGWEIKKLGDVVDFQRGLTYSKNDEVDFSDNIVLRSNNVDLKTNKLDFTELKYINPKIVIPVNKKVTKGSLIICTANGSKSHLGKVALIDDDYDYAFGGFMGLIKPKENLNSDFLFHLMTSEAYKKFIGALSDGANINNLKFGDLGEFEIPIPPLPEQQRIVSILDKAFAAIERSRNAAEQNLKNAKELFENYLQGVFENGNWETKKLNEITEVKDGTHDSPKYIKEGIPFVTQKNIKPDGLSLDDTKFITETDHEKFYKRSNVTFGDILISMIGANRGMAAIVDDKRVFSIKNVGLIKSSASINMNYLLYYLKSSMAMKYVLYMSNGGAQEFVGLTALRSFPIPYPSLKEQNEIVNKLDALSAETKRLEAIYQQKLENLDELKKSILQKAFAGELKTEKAELT
jgi:type I restriction enzyme S subunit